MGLPESVNRINFGNIYFVTIMVGATLGSRSSGSGEWMFLPGIIVLTGWMLLSASRSKPVSLLVALIIAGGIAVTGQLGIQELYDRLGSSSPGSFSFSPSFVSTLVGKSGAVNQSPDIVWRLRPAENTVAPRLLRTATYNDYRGGPWRIEPIITPPFGDLDTIEPVSGEIYHLLAPEQLPDQQKNSTRADLPRFTLRGAASAETPLPLPGNAASLRDFEQDGIERNSFGTVRIFPKHSVIDGLVIWRGELNPENPPFREDLIIPTPEREVLRSVLRELRLAEQPTLRDKLNLLHSWFQREFRYTRQLKIQSSGQVITSNSAIAQFLTKEKAGHCEYFATATSLLLREAGIPTRYAIGYAVMERDGKRKEFVIRGTHGHAWCRVWDAANGLWIDFDTTPASWSAALPPPNTAMQRFNDWLKRVREDFFLWRNRPANRLGVTLVMSALGLGVIVFVTIRLWRSKQRLESVSRRHGYEGPVTRTPLNELEPQAEKRLGARPPGQPLSAWLTALRPGLDDGRVLDEAIDLHQRLRFDPDPPEGDARERLTELAKRLKSSIRRK